MGKHSTAVWPNRSDPTMVKRSLSRAELLSKLEEQEDKFFENFAKEYLDYLGNSKPGKKQIEEMHWKPSLKIGQVKTGIN